MKNNGKKKRPTTVAYIVLFALAACALAVGIILQLTSVFNAAQLLIRFVAPGLFVSAVVVAIIDVRLNTNLDDIDKSRVTKGIFKMFGCGMVTVIFIAIIPIVLLVGVWIAMLIAYGSGL